jgi:hypothetical protein
MQCWLFEAAQKWLTDNDYNKDLLNYVDKDAGCLTTAR